MNSPCQGQGAVRFPPIVGSKHQPELAELTRCCIDRIGAEPGERARRETRGVASGISQSGFRTQFMLAHLGGTPAARSAIRGPELAVWDAMCRLEQMLRQRRAIAVHRRRSPAELLSAS
jgi:hypothetical protein